MSDSTTVTCPDCSAEISADLYFSAKQVCYKCGYHFAISPEERLSHLVDSDSFVELDTGLFSVNPLDFPDYELKLTRDAERTGRRSEIMTGIAEIGCFPVAIAVGDVQFMGGSMGSVVGEKLTRTIECATNRKLPLVTVAVSGGMRMQEGTLALMQMEKTAAACVRHAEAGLFHLSIVTDPTFGGTTASFASLGHVILAEPGARVGFAGPRAIASIREKLPDNFQKAEFLLEHGMIDQIIHRHEMRDFVVDLLDFCSTSESIGV
ncbi:TPA: acetyl-CoA carboxylase carboxyl transferase subunit beta [Candidatus Poribacteria bacterium]|nr:acetyl-CoA carboxylase carboxyl transferase subunit beta [Candidatus Poribacteria bacterium]HIA66932.1 acetyl-CoA carboxylase carboxyl transferase subunit beta [Candidatus Poribacteria bacterium]HIB86378.1 acetyl-CoA carboxylase carboxyl transferase subunit beta [Candidatus Poribacteria bacterium]HIC01945.1 acetyl-CoA carboxylase carboxyl transferase subunit beta [Candidatus Poribacteria bacterium]HIM11362.1 acetyl-CoA carboxylase carboxyl transferase subunit beta [Candidatus Poribacteria ba